VLPIGIKRGEKRTKEEWFRPVIKIVKKDKGDECDPDRHPTTD
jgi:hypothetical protein